MIFASSDVEHLLILKLAEMLFWTLVFGKTFELEKAVTSGTDARLLP